MRPGSSKQLPYGSVRGISTYDRVVIVARR